MWRQLLVFVVAVAASSCNGSPTGCDLILLPGIRVTVLDSISGRRLTADEVTVVAVDGAYADTARVGSLGTFDAVFDREGTYQVRVAGPGYVTWSREGIRVEDRHECGTQPIDLTARLQRET